MPKNKNQRKVNNIINNQYVTDSTIWSVDETFYTSKIVVFVAINIKTKAIIGRIFSTKPVQDSHIIELYSLIIEQNNNQKPIIIHSDLAFEYSTDNVKLFCIQNDIQLSLAHSKSFQNQLSESTINQLKFLTVLEALKKDSKALRALITTQPAQFKHKSNVSKAADQAFRQWLFESEYFQLNYTQFIQRAINVYNLKEYTTGITRKEAEYYNNKIESNTIQEMTLVSSNDIRANAIKNTNIHDIKEVQNQLTAILNSNQNSEQKVELIQSLIVIRQGITNQMLTHGFNELSKQNRNLSFQLSNQQKDLTSKFDEQKESLEVKINDLNFKLKEVIDELNLVKTEKIDKENARKARLNRKRKPKRQNMTLPIYNLLINKHTSNHYKIRRLRIAFCLLFITGVRISELLPVKVNQIKTLLQNKWIAIDRLKRGPANLKAFLSKEGARILNERKGDFQALFLSKTNEDFIFTSESKPNEFLRRETLTKEVNTALTLISQEMQNKPQISSHSFRAGYITELWRNTQDIEFVRQAIGHVSVSSTSSYVENLSDQEREQRIQSIKTPKELILNNSLCDDDDYNDLED